MAAQGTESEDKTIVLEIYYCQIRPKLRSLPQADRALSGCHQSYWWPECFWGRLASGGADPSPAQGSASHAIGFLPGRAADYLRGRAGDSVSSRVTSHLQSELPLGGGEGVEKEEGKGWEERR